MSRIGDLLSVYKDALACAKSACPFDEVGLYETHVFELLELERSMRVIRSATELLPMVNRHRQTFDGSSRSGAPGRRSESAFYRVAEEIERLAGQRR